MHVLTRVALAAGGVACLALAALLVLWAGLPERAAYSGVTLADGRTVAPEVGALAPDFDAPTADGGRVRLSDLRGQPVIVNFWATWCIPCELEMPELQALYDAHEDSDLRIVAVNLRESADVVRAWADDLALTYDLALDEDGAIAGRYALRGQPTTYVIAPDGVITHILYGPTTQAVLQSALEPYLMAAAARG